MHPQFNSRHRMGNILRRKVKTSIMHIVDLIKAHASVKAKSSARKSGKGQGSTEQPCTYAKPPLTRKLTADEISEAELALKRLQAEKKRLEDLLNGASLERHLSSHAAAAPAKSGQETSSCLANNNNNVKKELVKIPRYQQKTVFKLHNVFSDEECDQLLAELAENSTDLTTTATSRVCTTHSDTMAKRLWPVLQNEIPRTWMGNTLLGLSNRCVLERQSEGYSRKAAMDEAYEPVEGKEKSFLSVYVFLNDDYEGGESSFLKNWQPSAHDVQVRPQRGSVFVHQHNLLHEIKPVTDGVKHLVRYDVMYNTSKRDVLAEMYD